jgi:histidine triad (HIT) family protein
MPSLFTRIVQGEIPCYKVAENERFLAFLDIMPLTKGHVLVIPKTEVDYIFDIDDDLLGDMMIFAKKVALKMKRVLACRRIGLTVIGLEVPHAHIHLIPINGVSDMDFSKPKLQPSKEELFEVASMITEA